MSEFKKCKVIMLPTERHRDAIVQREGRLFTYNSKDSFKNDRKWHTNKYFNLYITSEEEIEVGDWFIFNNRIVKSILIKDEYITIEGERGFSPHKNDCYKIVATTDKSLMYTSNNGRVGYNLPQIPQSFIKQYCEAGGIDEIDMFNENIETDSGNYIILKPTKKSWTREEVEDMLFDISTELSWDDKDEDEKILNCQAKIKEIRENL